MKESTYKIYNASAGSGKTFTISGIEERISDDTSGSQWDGLIPRSVRYAFERIAASQEGR